MALKYLYISFFYLGGKGTETLVACSRRSDSGARAKTKASEPALSLALFFARAPLSERLEQAKTLGEFYERHPWSNRFQHHSTWLKTPFLFDVELGEQTNSQFFSVQHRSTLIVELNLLNTFCPPY